MVLVYLLAVLLFLVCFHISTRYSAYGRLIDKIPGPPALPIIGNLLLLNCPHEEFWSLFQRLCDKYYPIGKIWKLTSADLMILHPEDIKTILSSKKNITKASLYNVLRFFIGNGLILSDGSLWHSRRKIANQVFTPNLLDYYSKSTVKYANKLITEFRCQSETIILNTLPHFLNTSMQIALEATMGIDVDKINPDETAAISHFFTGSSDMIVYRLRKPYIRDWMVKFLPFGHQVNKSLKAFNEFATSILKEREAHLKKHAEYESDRIEDNEDEKPILFIPDALLQAEKDGLIDRRGSMDEILTFFFAAYETTGSQMSIILAVLAENKEAQDLLRAEILEVLGDGKNDITINDVKKMEYLDRCVKEVMRILPAVGFIGRHITDDVELSNYKIPIGSDVYLNLHRLHRDPNFWPNPEKFDPDRFLPENVHKRQPFSYVPFGAGLRNCIGYKLAMMQLRIVTAFIIHNFTVEPVDLIANCQIKIKITFSLGDFRVKLTRINHSK